MVSPDLASLLFPSLAVCIRRDLCAPELSLAELGACPVGGIKDKFLLLAPESRSNIQSVAAPIPYAWLYSSG